MDSGKSMHDICVLVTRPKHQAGELCELIHKQGGKTIIFPTIEITDSPDKNKMINHIRNITHFDIAIFVSANAVHQVASYWPQKPLKLSIFAIGPGTAKALSSYGISSYEIPKTFNSEGLLDLSSLKDIVGQKVVIFMGKDGRQLLSDTLSHRGAKVTTVICYQRQCPKKRLSKSLDVNIIVSTSSESLRNLLAMTDKHVLSWLLKTPLLVISQNMLQTAKELGFQKLIMADNASNEAVLKALQKWYSETQNAL